MHLSFLIPKMLNSRIASCFCFYAIYEGKSGFLAQKSYFVHNKLNECQLQVSTFFTLVKQIPHLAIFLLHPNTHPLHLPLLLRKHSCCFLLFHRSYSHPYQFSYGRFTLTPYVSYDVLPSISSIDCFEYHSLLEAFNFQPQLL